MFSRYVSRTVQAVLISIATASMPAFAQAEENRIEEFQQTVDAKTLAFVHLVNSAEVTIGNLALRRSEDSNVKAFATMIVKDHQQAQVQLNTLARRLNINPSLVLSQDSELQQTRTELAKVYMELLNLQGEDFDKRFLEFNVSAHLKAIEKLKAFLPNIQNETARAFINAIMPSFQQHHDEAKKLLEQL